METLQSTIFIEFDVNTKKITFLRGDNIIDYDSNITNIYVRVKYKNLSGNTVYLTPSELEDYEFSLYTIKPTTNNVNIITGKVTDELKENVYGGVVKFEIPRVCTNRLGIVKCEVHINQGNKIIGSSTFVLDVKQSLVTAFDDELLDDEDFPVLKQLILEIQKASNIDDNNRSKTTTYSSDKVETIKEDLSSQIKDKANADDVRMKNVNITLNDCDNDMLGAIQGGSDTQFILLSVPRDNSVTPEKTTFIECSANQFNEKTVTKNVYIDSVGGIVEDYRYAITDYILVAGKNKLSVYGFYGISYFDSSKNFLNRVTLSESEESVEGIIIPENAEYIRCTYTLSHEVNRQINLSDTFLPYDKYEKILSEDIMIKTTLTGKTLLSFGDSITYGFGNNGKSYIDYIAENNNMVKINKAISGASFTLCTDGRSHILEQITQMTSQKADFIVFNGLTNDVDHSPEWGTISEGYDGPFDVNTFCGGFESCCNLLKSNWIDSKILFVAVHKMCSRDKGGQDRLQALAKEMCNKWSIPYVDLYNEGLNTHLSYMKDRFTSDQNGVPDGVHPNELGYKTFYVNAIESKLKSI